jgi:hypothetical protein
VKKIFLGIIGESRRQIHDCLSWSDPGKSEACEAAGAEPRGDPSDLSDKKTVTMMHGTKNKDIGTMHYSDHLTKIMPIVNLIKDKDISTMHHSQYLTKAL